MIIPKDTKEVWYRGKQIREAWYRGKKYTFIATEHKQDLVQYKSVSGDGTFYIDAKDYAIHDTRQCGIAFHRSFYYEPGVIYRVNINFLYTIYTDYDQRAWLVAPDKNYYPVYRYSTGKQVVNNEILAYSDGAGDSCYISFYYDAKKDAIIFR